jgi:hypothetical protein
MTRTQEEDRDNGDHAEGAEESTPLVRRGSASSIEIFPPMQAHTSSRRRDTFLLLRGTVADLAKSIPDFSKVIQEQIRRNHAYTTMALCLCIIAHGYLYMSPFTYGGFMAVRLLDGVTVETAGRPTGYYLQAT